MFPIARLSRRTTLAFAIVATTITAASAATLHRFAITQTTGSGGAGAELQTSATGGAIQGEVASSVNTSIKLPFGVLGEYNAPGSTFGIGVIGLSTTGYALAGESLSATQPSILAEPGGNGMGLEAVTQYTSSSPAIFAQANGSGDGLDAYSGGGNGIAGYNTGSGSGIAGVNESTSGNNFASDTQYIGVYAQSSIGTALFATSGDSSNVFGAAILKSANDFSPTLYIANSSSDQNALLFQAQSNFGNLTIDGSGDINTSGVVNASQGEMARTRNPNSDEMSYGAESTEPTIEDVGRGRLIGGTATVAIAADFRETIDSSDYMVFLTPRGENNGLYIASQSAAGFVVRESHGGRSTLAFD